MEIPTSTTSVTLNIPNNKIVGQAMDVFEQYKPIVEEALNEARNTILFDDEFKEYIKGYVQRTIEKTIKEEVSRLIDSGIKSFGFVGDIKHCMSFNNRYEAMLSETGKRDIYHDSSMDFLFEDGSDFYNDISKMLIEIRKKKTLCEAYVCANDFIARKFINALALLHKYCPRDVKIIGFDNSTEAVSSKPYITTSGVDSSELGEMLLSTLILRIKNPGRAKIKIVVNTTLIRHDSTQTIF